MNPSTTPNSALSAPHSSCVLYGRLSKGDAALESHEARNVKYADLKEFAIISRFADEDTSGKIPLAERAGGRALLNRLKHGDIRHLIVAKLDRLGRVARDLLTTLETLQEYNVVLHIVDFGGDTITTQGHMGKFILTLFAGIAEWERSEICDRTQKRADSKFSHGELIGTIPYGFDCLYTFADRHTETKATALTVQQLAALTTAHGPVLSKLLVDNPAEQHRLRQMADLRTRHSLKWIADYLNDIGVPSKQGGRWQCGNVDRVLNSKHAARILNPPQLPTPALAQAA